MSKRVRRKSDAAATAYKIPWYQRITIEHRESLDAKWDTEYRMEGHPRENRILVFDDGSIRLITEEEFSQLWEEM